MKRSCFVALLALCAVSRGVADEPKPSDLNPEAVAKLLEAVSQPGDEHKQLEPLAGKWEYTSKFWMDPNQPPMEMKGTIERKWILGRRFLEETVTGKGPDGKFDFEGRGTIGYDNNEKKFTYNWICNMGTCSSNAIGTADKEGKVFTFEAENFCPIQQKKVKMQDEIQIESNDKHVLKTSQYLEGKEVPVMELTAERVK